MSGGDPFYTLHQGGQVPVQAQGQGNPVPINQAGGYGAMPSSMMPNQQHSQYQQRQHFQHTYTQHQQPHQTGEFRNIPERPRARRICETSDIRQERMTEADMRESLSEYVIYRLEKAPVEHDVDKEGNPAQPTWDKVSRNEVRGVQKHEARRRVRQLQEQTPLLEKMDNLKPGPQRQVEKLRAELEEQEDDPRYCYVIEQLDQKLEKITYEQYLRDKRNWPRLKEKELELAKQLTELDKSGKGPAPNSSKVRFPKEENGKSRQKKETRSITVYYKRMPKPDVDVVAMYENMSTKSGRADPPRENVEPLHQQRPGDLPFHHQQAQQHHGLQQPKVCQHNQNLQQPQYSQQHPPPQQCYPEQRVQNVSQQAEHLPCPGQQAQHLPCPGQQAQHLPGPGQPAQHLPCPGQQAQAPTHQEAPGLAVPGEPVKSIIRQDGSHQEAKGEPAKTIDVSPTPKKTKKPRDKHYPTRSACSSDSSLSDDDYIFSAESKTTMSTAPSDARDSKRGRPKKKGKGRRHRSESTDSSRSRSKGSDRSGRRSRHRSELYEVPRQHTLGEFGRHTSSSLGGPARNVPPPPFTERDSIPPAINIETVYNLGSMEGKYDEPASTRNIHAQRPPMRESDEDGPSAGGTVYGRRGYDRHDGSGASPYAKVYRQAEEPSNRAHGKQYYGSYTHFYDRGYPSTASDDLSDDYKYRYAYPPAPRPRPPPPSSDDEIEYTYRYTYTTGPKPRPQSPDDRREYERTFRRPLYRSEEPYMSGALQDRDESPRRNPFTPKPKPAFRR
ncbi:hypothetical protein VUR80DRAFT_6144 [Thermomyces stellatus]